MGTQKIITGYLKGLVKNWYIRVIALLDLLGLILLIKANLVIPIWIIIGVFVGLFIYANYILYRDGQLEIINNKENYRRDVEGLRTKIAELEDRYPQLSLKFVDDDRYTTYHTIHVKSPPEKPNFDELVEMEQERLKEIFTKANNKISNDDDIRINTSSIVGNLSGITSRPKTTEEYDKESNEYIKDYRSYLIKDYNYKNYLARYRRLNFSLENNGKVPAIEIILNIHFPNPFRFLSNNDWMDLVTEAPQSPSRPKTHQSIVDMMQQLSQQHNLISPWSLPGTSVNRPNVRGPFISKKNSTEVTFEIDELMHNFIQPNLEVGFFVLEDAVNNEWLIDYTIHAANLPKPVSDSLTIEVRTITEDG